MSGRVRRASGCLLVALMVLVGCSGGTIETPADTLAANGQPDSAFGYVIDAVPAGYELCGVSVPSALSVEADSAASLHVYADLTLEDPYVGVLYGVAVFPAGPVADLELGETVEVTVAGGEALLGGLDGLLIANLPAGDGQALTYRADAERIVQVAVRGRDDVDLVELAAGVVVADDGATLDVSVLPEGYGDLGDVYQLEGQPQFLFSLDHQLRDVEGGALEDQLTLLGAAGDVASMEAFRFRALSSERIVVGASDGVAANIGVDETGPFVVSWMADDNLILRLFSFDLDEQRLAALAESARRVDGEAWDDIRARYDPAVCQT